jgi:uncharacterized iron-regulated protein
MKRVPRPTVPALLIALALAPAAPAAAQQIGSDGLALLGAQIVVLGEVHDNAEHHANQALAVALLRPAALVFEMLSPERAAAATPANRESAARLGAALQWEASGWPDFAMYFPIFAAAPEATVRGAAVPRARLLHAIAEGAEAAFGFEAQRFGLAEPLAPEVQRLREAEQMAAHCNALPPERMAGMVAVQRLRDAALAQAALAALELTGGPVAVITGSGHARSDYGVPALLRRAAPGVSVLALGQIEAPAEEVQPYDRWIVTDPAPRGDPCLAFR